jgi:hypothetical protein
VPLGKYHALIIGVNKYQGWPELQFAHQDAESIRDILTSRYQFEPENISFLGDSDATRKNIITVLTRLLTDLGENDNLLIYYAGHGQLDPLTNSGYWIPVDGGAFDETSWIRFSTITEKITAKNVNAKNILLITDSCYGGALTRSGPSAGKSNPDSNGELQYLSALAQLADKPSRQVVASGGFEEVPDQSAFAEILKLNLLENTLPMIDVEYMFFKSVLPELIKIGTQRPRISKLASGIDTDGQFIFALRDQPTAIEPGTEPSDPIIVEAGDQQHSPTIDEPSAPPKTITPTTIEPIAVPPPQIVKFIANPLEIERGKMVTVSWETQNTVAVTLNGSSVALGGATKMLVPKSAVFILNAVNSEGDITSSNVRIEVSTPAPLIESFRLSQSTINAGQKTQIEWQIKNANKVEIIGIGKVNRSGKMSVSPQKTTVYEIIASNDSRTVRKKITLGVEALKPTILEFTATPAKIVYGAQATLRWVVSNAKNVTLNDKNVSAKATLNVKPKTTQEYTLVATAADGELISKKIKVAVSRITKPELPTIIRLPTINRPVFTTFASPIMVASGKASIKQTYHADLDLAGAPSNRDSDIWFQAKNASDRYITPRGNASLLNMGASSSGLAGCKKAKMSTRSINIKALKIADTICVKTSKGHFSEVKITSLPSTRANTLGIQFRTWK